MPHNMNLRSLKALKRTTNESFSRVYMNIKRFNFLLFSYL